ncbi:hypothetical protein V5O48_015614 [Marasmius crinis-equi]|uniref:Uncharacterized protein n=1 Tax=Marasmius crinis-equi TaxID=585013 RepID=A0ABR3EU02_9AGAR
MDNSNVQQAHALHITFPTPPTNLTSALFTWTRDPGDFDVMWLRKQKLDDPTGPTPLSEPNQVVLNGKSSGTSTLVFNRAGKFNIYIYKSDKSNDPKQSNGALEVVVSSEASAGTDHASNTSSATSGTQASSPTGSSDNAGSQTSQEKHNPNIGLIVGLTIGITLLLFIVAATFLFLRSRRRRHIIHFHNNRMMRPGMGSMSDGKKSNFVDALPALRFEHHSPPTEYDSEDGNDPPTIRDVRSVASSGSFSVTSPIARATRDRERKWNRLLRPSPSTTSYSASDITTSSTPLHASPSRARTDRQMLIEEKIQLLQSKIILLQSRHRTSLSSGRATPQIRPLPQPPGSAVPQIVVVGPSSPPPLLGMEAQEELDHLGRRVERLKQLHESDWALMLTNVPPEGLHD